MSAHSPLPVVNFGCKVRSAKIRKRSKIHLRLELPFEGLDRTRLCMKNISHRDRVSKVKTRLEKELGILPDMYYLSYLDSAPMEDSSRLVDHDIVEGGTLRINIWRMWQQLMKAAFMGNIKECFDCSLNIAGKSDWSKYCAWCALYMASHHGHHNLVAELLRRTSLAINFKTPCGWTALHAAARMGQWKVLCMLLNNGADVRITDNEGLTAFQLSCIHGHKKCENSLNFCQWNLQKYHIIAERKLDYDAGNARQSAFRLGHQLLDSTLNEKLMYRGKYAQLYMAHLPNPVTVAMVSKFEAEEKSPRAFIREQLHVKQEEEMNSTNAGNKLEFNYGWFDSLRAQQHIPCTRDIIKYSNPSSCQLRPHSLLNPGGYKTQGKVGGATHITFEL